MGDTIQQVKNQLNDFWKGLNKKKKIKLGISSLLIVVGVTVLIVVVSRPKYDVLYENLSLKDTAQVTKKLDEMNIKWKTGKKDNVVLVPKDKISKIKLELASEGLPKEGYGFVDAFNDSSWSMTEYEKKERMKYALENELASTISQIDGIEDATVYINEEEDTNFALDENLKEPTASVLVKKSNNIPLSSDKIYSIKNLVSGSINMDVERVNVIDDSGKMLGEDNDTPEYTMTDQYTLKQDLQMKIDESIKKFLGNVFGYENVDARSSVKVNFDSETTKVVEFSPPIEGNEEGLARSMEEVEKHTIGYDKAEPVGQESNPPDYVNTEDVNSKYDEASKTINYELNEINKEIKKAPGQVESITVAVLINKDSIADGELTEEKREEIVDLVGAATGMDTKQVKVSADSFNNGQTPLKSPEKGRSNFNLLTWILIGALGASGVLSFVLYRRKKRMEREQDDIKRMLEENKEKEEIGEINFETEESEMKAQIEKFIEKRPDAVAQLLRSWLNE